jgi:hypothetical protein
LNFPLFFLRCSFREGIDCKYAQTRTISLNGSFVRELAGNAVSINGTFNLAKNFSGEGEICLVDAEISGSLVFIDGVISNPGGIAISADRARIGGGVFFREGFKAVGEVRLAGSRINAGLDGTGSVFSNPGKIAFSADKATIDGDIFLV